MGLRQSVDQLWLDRDCVAYRPSQAYTTALSAYTIFTITGGAILATTLMARITGAAVGGETIVVTCNGVAEDAAATAINGAVGTVVYLPLNVAGTIINAAAIPKTVATLTSMIIGTGTGVLPGLIVATFATGTSCTCEFALVYKRLNPAVVVS